MRRPVLAAGLLPRLWLVSVLPHPPRLPRLPALRFPPSLRRPARLVLAGLLVPALLRPVPARSEPALAADAVPRNDRFGLVFVNGPGYGVSEDRYRLAVEAGAGWTRWPFDWNEIERTPGVPDYAAQDAVVARDLEHGLQINGILVAAPRWTVGLASPAPAGQPGIGGAPVGGPGAAAGVSPRAMVVPGRLDAPVFNEDGSINRLNYWAGYVYTTVSRYKGRIKVWEMWNEPDWPGWFWTGTPADYYRLLKVGYLAAKKADPSVTVLFGGLCHWCGNPDFFADVLTEMAADPTARANNFYFDVLPLHIYVNPYYIYRFAEDHRRAMRALGFEKPIWINEANVPVCGDPERPLHACPSDWRGSLAEQANFVIQLYALAAASGIERTMVFQFADDGIGYELYGLVRNDGKPRPSYSAYQTAARYFSGYKSARIQSRPAYDQVVFTGGPWGQVTVIWNNTGLPQTAEIPAIGSRATLVTKSGEAGGITPTSAGTYRLLLEPATFGTNQPIETRHYIGGDPLIVVEQPDPPARPATATLSDATVADASSGSGGAAASEGSNDAAASGGSDGADASGGRDGADASSADEALGGPAEEVTATPDAPQMTTAP